MDTNDKKAKMNWLATASLSLGVASIILWEFSIIPILAVGFGMISLFQKKNVINATIGVALGIVFLIVRIGTGHIDRSFLYAPSTDLPQASTLTTPQNPTPTEVQQIPTMSILESPVQTTTTADSVYAYNQQLCDSRKENLEKSAREYNGTQNIEDRGNNYGPSYCFENKKIEHIYYSEVLDSCLHVERIDTWCGQNVSGPYNTLAYEYFYLFNGDTGGEIGSVRTISRGEGYENYSKMEVIINNLLRLK
jgi:hypothetical protein